MLRAGVSLPALMRLLGHHNANMTLLYVEVTQQDLHREYEAAQQRPRHLVPRPPALAALATSSTEAPPPPLSLSTMRFMPQFACSTCFVTDLGPAIANPWRCWLAA